MEIGLTVLIWLGVICIATPLIMYGFAFIISIILMLKNKKNFELFQEKTDKEHQEYVKRNEKRMEELRKKMNVKSDLQKRVEKELDKHFEEDK